MTTEYANFLLEIMVLNVVAAVGVHGQAYLLTWENNLAQHLGHIINNRTILNGTGASVLENSTDNLTQIIIYKNSEEPNNELSQTAMDVITIIWYVATFLALAAFFMLMACSDRRCRHSQNARNTAANAETPMAPPTPSPSYSEFAPPSYDTVIKMRNADKTSIFVIPFAVGNLVKDETNENNNQTQTPAINVYTINEMQKTEH